MKIRRGDKRMKREKTKRGRKDKGKDKDEIEISAGGAGRRRDGGKIHKKTKRRKRDNMKKRWRKDT